MEWSFLFFFNSALLGVGLAMDAFSVSMANGLHDPKMSKKRMAIIAGTFGVFQAVMPMTGWICVHTIVELFSSFEVFIPWIALALLAYIGGKMLLEGIKGEEAEEAAELSAGAISERSMGLSLSVAVSAAGGLAMLRVITGISIMYFLVPGYLIAIALSFFVPRTFTAIAFDSGGVASGPLTATFMLPFKLEVES